MAKDDMYVIAYKILRYLSECAKQDKMPSQEDICAHCKLFDIPDRYWTQIMLELIEEGYIRGFTTFTHKGGVHVQMLDYPSITLKGAAFLAENSRMKAAEEFLGRAFETVLMAALSVK